MKDYIALIDKIKAVIVLERPQMSLLVAFVSSIAGVFFGKFGRY